MIFELGGLGKRKQNWAQITSAKSKLKMPFNFNVKTATNFTCTQSKNLYAQVFLWMLYIVSQK